ncbi:MAG: hypothetical protein ACYTEZ_16120 [Planctomycetota bacterium]
MDRTAVVAERDLKRICALLDIPVTGTFKIYLYDGVPELAAITRTTGNAGFSAGDASHIPYDNDQTRFHELVHVVAHRLPKSGAEPRSLFFADGLANALLEFVHGVHVHAVASFYRRRRQLPALEQMTAADFYAWLRDHPGFNAYDVAASWIRFLLDAHGIQSVKRYYTGTPAKEAFGVPRAKLETAWHRLLDGYALRPEVETLLRQRHGEAVRFRRYPLAPEERLPPEVRGRPEEWQDLADARLRPQDPAEWSREQKVLRGRRKLPTWSWCELGTRKYSHCAVRAVVVADTGTLGVALRVGETVQALLVLNGVFHYRRDQSVKWNLAEKLRPQRKIHFVLVRKGGAMEVWLDGFRVLTSRTDKKAAPVAVGVAGGSARFEKVAVRAFRP